MKSISHIWNDTLVACIPHSSDEMVEKIRPSQLWPDGSVRSSGA